MDQTRGCSGLRTHGGFVPLDARCTAARANLAARPRFGKRGAAERHCVGCVRQRFVKLLAAYSRARSRNGCAERLDPGEIPMSLRHLLGAVAALGLLLSGAA